MSFSSNSAVSLDVIIKRNVNQFGSHLRFLTGSLNMNSCVCFHYILKYDIFTHWLWFIALWSVSWHLILDIGCNSSSSPGRLYHLFHSHTHTLQYLVIPSLPQPAYSHFINCLTVPNNSTDPITINSIYIFPLYLSVASRTSSTLKFS